MNDLLFGFWDTMLMPWHGDSVNFLAIWDGDQPVTVDSPYNGLAFIFLLAWANPWQAFG